jgi:26S proteasome regulatory subunit N9
LWHQLTAALEELVNLPQFEKGIFLLDLYQNFIKTFESHLQQLRLVHMVIKISKQINSKLNLGHTIPK